MICFVVTLCLCLLGAGPILARGPVPYVPNLNSPPMATIKNKVKPQTLKSKIHKKANISSASALPDYIAPAAYSNPATVNSSNSDKKHDYGKSFKRAKQIVTTAAAKRVVRPPVRAKAMFCLDCSANKIVLARNVSEPLPIASITKLLTAMVVVDEMDLNRVIEVPHDISEVERHVVGIKAGDLFSIRDLLHGMLIESGNDCAEAIARSYRKGGRDGFVAAMNRKATALGAGNTMIYTPSGLDLKITLGSKNGRSLETRRPNVASAEEVALIAKTAFANPLIASITSMKKFTMVTKNSTPKNYPLFSNDKLLSKNLPVAGAKTGYTNMAGKCIVALFKNEDTEHMVVVLNTDRHFKAAENIYKWACKAF